MSPFSPLSPLSPLSPKTENNKSNSSSEKGTPLPMISDTVGKKSRQKVFRPGNSHSWSEAHILQVTCGVRGPDHPFRIKAIRDSPLSILSGMFQKVFNSLLRCRIRSNLIAARRHCACLWCRQSSCRRRDRLNSTGTLNVDGNCNINDDSTSVSSSPTAPVHSPQRGS